MEVRVHGDAADLAVLDADRVTKLARAQQLDTVFADMESGTILTARPEELQRFAVRHLTDGQLFEEPIRLRRVASLNAGN